MKHQFRKEDPKTFELLPKGAYLLQVIKAETKLSKGVKTKGCDQLEMSVKSVQHGNVFFETLTFPNDSTAADTVEFLNNRINCFLQSVNMAPQDGENVDLSPEAVINRQGWAEVIIDEGKQEPGKPAPQKRNKVLFWYTDKEKLPRVQPQAAKAAATPGGDDFDNA